MLIGILRGRKRHLIRPDNASLLKLHGNTGISLFHTEQ